MALKDFQYGDYQSTIARKLLQNEVEVVNGTLSFSVTGGAASSGNPLDFSPGDSEAAILGKYLRNEADVMRGVLAYSTA